MKKLFLSISVIMLIFSLNASAARFDDIKNHWAENTINRIANMGIVDGEGEHIFNPNGMVTRAQYLKMIMNLVHIETVPYRSGECLDANADDWYAPYLQSALDKGLIPKEMIASYRLNLIPQDDGSSKPIYSGAFNGNLPIDREEMAVFTMHLYQYALNAETVKDMFISEVRFSDRENISVWAQPSVKLAAVYGFIEGMDDGRFMPLENATRAQAATILGRIIDKTS